MPLEPVENFLHPDATFMTFRDYTGTSSNPHFIATYPRHPFLKQAIDVYLEELSLKPYTYWGYSITHVIDRIVKEHLAAHGQKTPRLEEGLYKTADQTVQIASELCPNIRLSMHNCRGDWNGRTILKNRDDAYDPFAHAF